jgi:hypothetical protein
MIGELEPEYIPISGEEGLWQVLKHLYIENLAIISKFVIRSELINEQFELYNILKEIQFLDFSVCTSLLSTIG